MSEHMTSAEKTFSRWQKEHWEFRDNTLVSFEEWDPKTGEPVCTGINCAVIGKEVGGRETHIISPTLKYEDFLLKFTRLCPVLLFSGLKRNGEMTHQFVSRRETSTEDLSSVIRRRLNESTPTTLKPINPNYPFCRFLKDDVVLPTKGGK